MKKAFQSTIFQEALKVQFLSCNIFRLLWSLGFITIACFVIAKLCDVSEISWLQLATVAALIVISIGLYRIRWLKVRRQRLARFYSPNASVAAFIDGRLSVDELAAGLDRKNLHEQSVSHTQALLAVTSSALYWHAKPHHNSIETLNRLWRASPLVKDRKTLPFVHFGNVTAVLEHWDLTRLYTLLHPSQKTTRIPKCRTAPIILLRFHRTDYLIDGRTRINCWMRERDTGPHRVIIIHIETENKWMSESRDIAYQ